MMDSINLAQQSDMFCISPQIFINTELYARVSVAGLFQKLADLANMAEPACQNEDYQDAIVAGKLFLLELLDAAVHIACQVLLSDTLIK